MKTGFCWHELFAWHDAGKQIGEWVEPIGALDTPESKRRFRNLVEASGLLPHLAAIEAREATDKEILRVHRPEHLARIKEADAEGGTLGRMAHIASGGLRIVRLAAGAAIAAVDAIMVGEIDNAYALVRPAGHHATDHTSSGYCILNNVAIAARHALEAHQVERVAIVDWDVHWGNGTQQIFWTEPAVLAISIHQNELLSVRGGYVDEIGEGPGRGAIINIPLPPGSGHGAYIHAFEQVILPALDRFQPDLIIVASGLDALSHDTYGRMMLHSGTYREMTALLLDAAQRLSKGRLLLCHEGGYSPILVPFAGLAILETLSGRSTDVTDPFRKNVETQSYQKLQAHQKEVILRAAEMGKLVPSRG